MIWEGKIKKNSGVLIDDTWRDIFHYFIKKDGVLI